MDLGSLKSSLMHAFQDYLGGIISGLPAVISGLAVLLVGWLLARLFRTIVRRLCERAGLDEMARRTGLATVLGKLHITSFPALLGTGVYVLVLLVFLVAAADIMHLTGVTRAIDRLFAYLPTLLTALAIFVAGLWAAEKAKAMLGTMMDSIGLGGGKVIASVVSGILILFMTITALNVAGVDTTLITSNILIMVAGVLVAFSIAYGFAARDILTSILSSYYGKDRFKPGMRVRIGQDEGVIEKIDSISIVIRTTDRLVLLPTSQLITQRIEVLSEEVPDPE